MLQVGRSPFRVPDEMEIFHLPNPSGRTTALGSTQPLTEMTTRNIPRGKKRPALKADNLAECLNIVEASTSRNPKGLHGLHRYNLNFTFI
jgi:hypothetical protein